MKTTTWYGLVCRPRKGRGFYPRYFQMPSYMPEMPLEDVQANITPSAVKLFTAHSRKNIKSLVAPSLAAPEDTGQIELLAPKSAAGEEK